MTQAQLQILLIEDLPVYTLLIQRMLSIHGITLESAASLADGFEKASQHSYDAVLLDLGLPDSHGINTFTRFQSFFPGLPVIIFSNLDDEALAARAVQLGAQDYITKGTYLTQGDAGNKLLARAIYYAIERHQIQSQLLTERTLLEERVSERTTELSQANQRLRTLTARLVSAQEDERRRISLDLHDEAGQGLTALKLSLALIRSEIPADLDQLSKQMEDAIMLTETTIEQVRTLAQNLRPPSLDNAGLDQCLRDYCQNLSQRSGISFDYHSYGIDKLPDHIQISLYRVIQESINNVLKHAMAHCVEVHLVCDAEAVTLTVRDDGRGFSPQILDPQTPRSGLGLLGMQERVEALGGTLEINSQLGRGVALTARIPLEEE